MAVAKFATSATLIFVLVRRANFSEIAATVNAANLPLLLIGMCMFVIAVPISARRWKILLRTQGINIPIWTLIQSFMIGVFFNNFLPSTVGGDAFRVYDSWRFGGGKAESVGVIFLDRIFGLAVLLAFAAVGMAYSGQVLDDLPALRILILASCAGASVFVLSLFFPTPRILRALPSKPRGAPGFVCRLAARAWATFRAFGGRKDLLYQALLLSAALQVVVVMHYRMLAWALHFEVPTSEFFVVVPLALFLMMIPVSINGVGVRESAFVFFLAPFGVSTAEALAFSWISYASILIQGALGGLIFASRPAPGRVPPSAKSSATLE